ncbi:MAG: hypothetical protein H6622_04995 [Halobacteriovoraceae bacterium]|nr:hypothetical protein [Halobacteriovoraceae bacterium]
MSESLKKKKKKKTNPLYAVSENGKTVEEASGPIDFIIKSLGLTKTVEILSEIFQFICTQVETYAGLKWLNEFVVEWIKLLRTGVSQFTKLFSAALATN